MSISKLDLENLISTIQQLYLCDEIPWMIGYSGGKDSTAALQLLWLSISRLDESKRSKPVYIMNTNTMVESPVISQWVEYSLRKMEQTIKEDKLPFIVTRLTPEPDQTFWVNFIGRGYPYPRKKFRWCTDRLKIKPVNNFIQKKISTYGEIVLVLGTRKAESTHRAKTMNKLEAKRVRDLLSPNPTLANELVFSPLEDWDTNDVWTFLLQYKNPWGLSNLDLMTLYKGATADEECPIMTEKDMPTCGNSRFGCWVCTMVSQDKSMEAMITNDQDKVWMYPLLEFRNSFALPDEIDRNLRSFRRMHGNLSGSYQKLYHGPYLQEVREARLKNLLLLQKQIQKTAPEEFKGLELITVEELRAIRRIWVKEKHEFLDSVPRIYEEVYGVPFTDPEWVHSASLGAEEWNLLKEICYEMFPDEELLFESIYTMLDLEDTSDKDLTKKELGNELKKVIAKTFYKNEEDAVSCYTNANLQRKELRSSYNGKFLEETTKPLPRQLSLFQDANFSEQTEMDKLMEGLENEN